MRGVEARRERPQPAGSLIKDPETRRGPSGSFIGVAVSTAEALSSNSLANRTITSSPSNPAGGDLIRLMLYDHQGRFRTIQSTTRNPTSSAPPNRVIVGSGRPLPRTSNTPEETRA
jgi:hypothetical protein